MRGFKRLVSPAGNDSAETSLMRGSASFPGPKIPRLRRAFPGTSPRRRTKAVAGPISAAGEKGRRYRLAHSRVHLRPGGAGCCTYPRAFMQALPCMHADARGRGRRAVSSPSAVTNPTAPRSDLIEIRSTRRLNRDLRGAKCRTCAVPES